MRQIDLKDLNLGQEQWSPEQGQQAAEQIRQRVTAAKLNTTKLAEIGEWARRVIENPEEFPAFQSWLREQGLPESKIPKEPDMQQLAAMAAMGYVSQQQDQAQTQSAGSESAGPVSPEQVAAMGRSGDTMLAHINPQEAAMLESMGGMGTINPQTGLPEYGFFSDLWDGITGIVKDIAPFILPVVALAFPPLIPAIGTALGASAALAPVVGAAVLAGGATALSGGSIKDVLSSAAMAGLGTYLTPIVGDFVGSSVGVTDVGIKSIIGSATLAGGLTALRGGSVGQILTSAASGAAANYLGQIAKDALGSITNVNATQKAFDDSVFTAADARQLADQGLNADQIAKILGTTGLPPEVVNTATNLAVNGASADSIAAALTNQFGAGATLYSDNATGAERSLTGGANEATLEQLQRTEDSTFLSQQARNTMEAAAQVPGADANNIKAAIVRDLMASGVDWQVATNVADSTLAGYTVQGAADNLLNNYSRIEEYIATPDSTSEQSVRIANANQQFSDLMDIGIGVDNSVQAAMSGVQAGDITRLSNQGLNQSVIADNLYRMGLDPNAANNIAATAYENVGGSVMDARMLATDAVQMATQGLGQADIARNLIASGVNPDMANQVANMAASGFKENALSSMIVNQLAPATGGEIYGAVPVAPTAPTTAPTAPVAPAGPRVVTERYYDGANFRDARTGEIATQGADGRWYTNTQTMPEVVVTADREPGFGDFVPEQQPGGNISAAQFDADDALQLAAQTNNNTAAVQQNLVYAGMDPALAAQVANMATSGATRDQITAVLSGEPEYQAPPATIMPVEEPNLGGGIRTDNLPVGEGYELVGSTPTTPGYNEGDLGTGITQPTYPGLPEMGGGTGLIVPGVTPEAPPVLVPDLTPPLTDAQTGAIVAQPVIDNAAGDLTPINQPGTRNYGTFTPAPPDPSWSIPLQYPGMNPGLVGAGIRPAYETTSPVQSQYYWGRQPYFAYPQDLENYNLTPAAPVQPWGLQQGFFEQPAPYTQVPVYGENMFVQAQPQAQLSSYAAQPQPMTQPVMPVPMVEIAMPAQPNYVYSVVPTATQYSVPTAAPV